MKKIGIVSFCYEAKEFNKNIPSTANYRKKKWDKIPTSQYSKFNNRRIKEISEIAQHAKHSKITHLLFPGNTLLVNKRSYDCDIFEEQVKKLSDILRKFSFIMEVPYRDDSYPQDNPPIETGIFCFEKGNEVGERIQQLFYTSDDPEFYYKRLWAETNWGHRIKELQGLKFLIWICGEINFLKSRDKLNFKIEPRYSFNNNDKGKLKKLNYDVFFNPAHTPMGEANKVQKKLAYLSKSERLGIHTTNVPTFATSAKSAIYCFANGKQHEYKQKNNWHQENSWIMETIAVK